MLGGFLFICPFFVLTVNLCEKKPMCISEALSQQIFVGFEGVLSSTSLHRNNFSPSKTQRS